MLKSYLSQIIDINITVYHNIICYRTLYCSHTVLFNAFRKAKIGIIFSYKIPKCIRFVTKKILKT